jgi:hypothetical protein
MLGILIGGLFTFAFGGMLLIVVLGARRVEDELKERAKEVHDICADAARIPRFFLANQPADHAVASHAVASHELARPDEALIGQLQQYLEAEQHFADEFVLQPSIESLYRESGRRLTVH